eukprot:TRINITY_DN66164_c0_g1_i1.p1 TRINITY_DN66164_c0_g1~~TRINITY_DN66164_c0_g1_i1.p1  ORF type:complete len:416 (+),score=49.29 TRINITY_DN66164_c0_g1_i1:113-1360(+)
MVIQYESGSEGSVFSFCTVTPCILSRCKGSAIPLLLPQLILAAGSTSLAEYLRRHDYWLVFNADAAGPAFQVIGVLLAFLLVFKTQSAYQQFWQASGHVDGLLQVSRSLAMLSVNAFSCTDQSDQEARRIVRLITLHYFVVIEFLMRSGMNATRNKELMDRLREDVRMVTGEHEFLSLYPHEPGTTPGSESTHRYANPSKVLFFISLCYGRVYRCGECAPPVFTMLHSHVGQLSGHFWGLNKIDKTQFPLPYNQIVKLLIIFYVFSMPFRIIASVELWGTLILTLLATLGFFGLDEVAEILESPLGNDPNDINLRQYGRKLLKDLSMIYHNRNMELDTVFSSEDDFDLSNLLSTYDQQVVSWKDGLSYLVRSSSGGTAWSSLSRKTSQPTRTLSHLAAPDDNEEPPPPSVPPRAW